MMATACCRPPGRALRTRLGPGPPAGRSSRPCPTRSTSGADGAPSGDGEATQQALASTTAETTQPTPAGDPSAATTQPTPPAANGATGSANGEAGPDPDATQRLEPVGNTGPKSRSSKPASKESKGRP